MDKLTDEQTKKALECCFTAYKEYPCEGCPLEDLSLFDRRETIRKAALDLINRYEAEIERLQGLLSEWKTEAYKLSDNIDNIKSEAIKECTKKLKSIFGEWIFSYKTEDFFKEMVDEGISKGVTTMTDELKPCPFCGGKTRIVVCDYEGNIRDTEYEKDPWSGLGYLLYHDITDVPDGKECPIAGREGERALGRLIYDTREEAIELWNKRVDNDRQRSVNKVI